jgi:Cytochrome c554 and c-prime
MLRRNRTTSDILCRIFALIFLAIAAQRLAGRGQEPSERETSQPTTKRLQDKGWWPTKRDAARGDFAGTDACMGCHKDEVDRQRQTPMAHAAWKAPETEALRSNALIANTTEPFKTEIVRDRKGSTYSVARGGDAITGQILWSMGDGIMGQTFVVQSGEGLCESQLSYFQAIGGLDLTPGHERAAPQDLEHAFGLRQTMETVQQCFGCHTTGSSVRGGFDQARATPGVTCEACHGPGARHVKAMKADEEESGKSEMLDPRMFGPVKLVDFCGACHRAPLDVIAAKDFLPINIRFQPYRLSKSRCWSRPDPRLTCIACHDPHENLVQDAGYYDGKCLACHGKDSANPLQAGEGSQAVDRPAICKVSSRNCVSCHMPKYAVPRMHGSFTDHDIRVVRQGEQYPL